MKNDEIFQAFYKKYSTEHNDAPHFERAVNETYVFMRDMGFLDEDISDKIEQHINASYQRGNKKIAETIWEFLWLERLTDHLTTIQGMSRQDANTWLEKNVASYKEQGDYDL